MVEARVFTKNHGNSWDITQNTIYEKTNNNKKPGKHVPYLREKTINGDQPRV